MSVQFLVLVATPIVLPILLLVGIYWFIQLRRNANWEKGRSDIYLGLFMLFVGLSAVIRGAGRQDGSLIESLIYLIALASSVAFLVSGSRKIRRERNEAPKDTEGEGDAQ
ncbi:Uncharacterised protein [Mycobacteroides abscessus subsp. bolletii]|uniref:hypothetical protein n=1 Tax=Mycobacteroides abscessus TaxID=36809 RepID=UPI000666A096|nr:hypothetical protein [Mycobacteroides abscessus]AKP59766.1 hypothetical protein MAUC22_21010 [Mycobacteroides abscessus UC22]AWG49683.1 hypothetical protein DDT48_09945 [Mycobacteroides abscessus]MDM2174714.1 hypothetical protein [Mycobacteroides abscessus]MDM2179128.1 hypothetical protein [Mycobacteroides abscessus]MDM2205516.1 hypothetical protein [Mycobacteroides abscessus]